MSDENNKNIENSVKKKINFLSKVIIILLIIIFLFFILQVCFSKYYQKILFKKDNISEKYIAEWSVVNDVMTKPRSSATANLLPDGNVLIMGGSNMSSDTADIFDPVKQKIIKTIGLNDSRAFGYTTTQLSNGDIFVVGGTLVKYKDNKLYSEITNTTKIFDSKNYLFFETKPTKYISGENLSFLLRNGHVLILNNALNVNEEEYKKRENMKFQIYNPVKNEYYDTQNGIHRMFIRSQYMILQNGDILFKCNGIFRYAKNKKAGASSCLYDFKENKFEISDDFPTEQLFVQLDSENYLAISPKLEYAEGYIYNIKTKEKILAKNKINRTWRPGIHPQMVVLEDGNVLILGIPLKNSSDKYETSGKNRKTSKYSAYIYSRSENKFYEVQPPPLPVYRAGIVRLKNGDILLAGGTVNYKTISNKIQIFRYKK